LFKLQVEKNVRLGVRSQESAVRVSFIDNDFVDIVELPLLHESGFVAAEC
jgi:hypothetical protein